MAFPPLIRRRAFRPLLLVLVALAGACSSTPPRVPDSGREAPSSLGARIAADAMALLGRPYRYGGNGPEAFDCSGLVRYVHLASGIAAPRTTADQFRAARPVPREQLAAGDLLFFRIGGSVSHVGIYAGDGRFVHAPQTGRNVETRGIDDSYYRTRLVGIGRLF